MKTFINVHDTKITLQEVSKLGYEVYSNGNLIGYAGFELLANAWIYTSLLTAKKRKFKTVEKMVQKLDKEKA